MSLMVSICCITYNHASYIGDALDGFLNQVTDFEYEILVFDDASTDGTDKVVARYMELHPGRITYVRHAENVGMMKNFHQALRSSSGAYVALCEGDDYWVDTNKLQTQVDFLEANKDFALCFHATRELLSDGVLTEDSLNTSREDKEYTILDLAEKNFIHTPSVVYRNKLIASFPDWFEASPAGDYVLHLLNAQFGKIKYFPAPMAVYRRHGQSVWSSLQDTTRIKKWLTVLQLLASFFQGEVREKLMLHRYHTCHYLLDIYKSSGDRHSYSELLKNEISKDPELFQLWLDNDFKTLMLTDQNYPLGIKKAFAHLVKSCRRKFMHA